MGNEHSEVSLQLHANLHSLIELRKELHRMPELSGREKETAGYIARRLASSQPDEIVSGLGGHGLACIFKGQEPGPTVMIRCELDALPIQESNTFSHASAIPGRAHMCGHDGHMAIVAGVAMLLGRFRPQQGRIVLLFQPAEETGSGAAAVLADKKFTALRPDLSFALHNMPGYPLGAVIVKSNAFACASQGLIVELTGKTSHAAYPEDGLSPAAAMCRIIEELPCLPSRPELNGLFSLVTIIHARLGETTFGTAPGNAVIMATLRAETDEHLQKLLGSAEELIHHNAQKAGLQFRLDSQDAFAATINHPAACQIIEKAASAAELPWLEMSAPLRASEDFGGFTAAIPGALFGLGAGSNHPQLHNSDYDFPDQILAPAILILWHIISLSLKCELHCV